MKKLSLLFWICISFFFQTNAREPQDFNNVPPPTVLAGCSGSTSQIDLDINNVRAKILGSGDMWRNIFTSGGGPAYEIPKGSKKNSLFAGAIWIGGYAPDSSLRLAAMTYRQPNASMNDFWPGPITTISGSPDVDPSTCRAFDKHWKLYRDSVEDWVNLFKIDSATAIAQMPQNIKEYPGNGDYVAGYPKFLAPFNDLNGNGTYEPTHGEYPWYELSNKKACDNRLFGDQTIWWVFNDVGNAHTSTGCTAPIGIEVQTQAFAFATADDLNNTTFYRYKLINRNTTTLSKTYFGLFCDPDLGYYLDDYVGCDVARNLGYVYNGDGDDQGWMSSGYGINPPAVGFDFLEGPVADIGDAIDNNQDSCLDCTWYYPSSGSPIAIPDDTSIVINGDTIYGREKNSMSYFISLENCGSATDNPSQCVQFYSYMTGKWKAYFPLTYGGCGMQSGDSCHYMFPSYPWGGTSDPKWYGTNGKPQFDWNEVTAGNPPGDRRIVQSTGPFTLHPGEVNNITLGTVWARAASGDSLESLRKLLKVDDYVQTMFDNCFQMQSIQGPDAPDLTITGRDGELDFILTNSSTSNNYNESYIESDPFTAAPSNFVFEGYKVYELKDGIVTQADRDDTSSARLILQCDIANGVTSITNWYYQKSINSWNPIVKVVGNNTGTIYSLNRTTSAFTGAPLVNGQVYYYMAVAYAYNPAEVTSNPLTSPAGINKPYLEGSRNVKIYAVMPVNRSNGNGPEITRIQGTGNGYLPGYPRPTMELKEDAEYQKLFAAPFRITHATYKRGKGPVDVRIIDPAKLKSDTFELWLTDTTDSAHWILKNVNMNKSDTSTLGINSPYQHYFPNYGLWVTMGQVKVPDEITPGIVETEIRYSNPANDWLGGAKDNYVQAFDWINPPPGSEAWNFSLFDGTWAPYKYVTQGEYGVALANSGATNTNNITKSSSIDLVITSDRAKWSRCAVLEEQANSTLAIGNAPKILLRKSTSLKLDASNNLVPDTGYGMSYFPGYAVNVETGERLNIAFGEDSYISNTNFPGQSGDDMKWNPTSNFTDVTPGGKYFVGGKHVIYIFNHIITPTNVEIPAYDEGSFIYNALRSATSAQSIPARNVFIGCMYVGYPLLKGPKLPELAPGEFLPCYYPVGHRNSNDARVRIRVTQPYEVYNTKSPLLADSIPHYLFAADSSVIGIDEKKQILKSIVVYPNPTSGLLKIQLLSSKSCNYIMNVFDVTGKVFSTKTIMVGVGETFIDLNLTGYAKGIYFIRFKSADESQVVKVLVN